MGNPIRIDQMPRDDSANPRSSLHGLWKVCYEADFLSPQDKSLKVESLAGNVIARGPEEAARKAFLDHFDGEFKNVSVGGAAGTPRLLSRLQLRSVEFLAIVDIGADTRGGGSRG